MSRSLLPRFSLSIAATPHSVISKRLYTTALSKEQVLSPTLTVWGMVRVLPAQYRRCYGVHEHRCATEPWPRR